MNMRARAADMWWHAKEERGETLARLANIGLGALTIAAVFHWPDRLQFTNTVITGAVIIICAVAAWLSTPWLRIVNTAAGLWLFFSPTLLPWQNRWLAVAQMGLGLAVVICSFFPLFSVSADEGDILPPVPHHA